LIRKQVANTGQLRRRLYHIPISFVLDWADGLEAKIGERMIGSSERSIKESRLMSLLVSHRFRNCAHPGYVKTHVDFRTRVLNSRSLDISSDPSVISRDIIEKRPTPKQASDSYPISTHPSIPF
jgi:hypothetical protein